MYGLDSEKYDVYHSEREKGCYEILERFKR